MPEHIRPIEVLRGPESAPYEQEDTAVISSIRAVNLPPEARSPEQFLERSR